MLYVIYNLLKHAFKNRFEERGDPRSVCYCTGLEFLFPSHMGPLRVYLRAWIWKIQLQHTTPLPEQHCRTMLSSYSFERTDATDKISIKGIWAMGPKNHHISYHSKKMPLLSGGLYVCVAPNHQLFFQGTWLQPSRENAKHSNEIQLQKFSCKLIGSNYLDLLWPPQNPWKPSSFFLILFTLYSEKEKRLTCEFYIFY